MASPKSPGTAARRRPRSAAMCVEVRGPRGPDPMSPAVGGSLTVHDGDLRDRDPDGRVAPVARRPVLDVRLAGRRGARPSPPTARGRSMARVEGLPFSIDWLPDGRLVATTPPGVRRRDRDLAPYGAAGQPFNEIVVDARRQLLGGHARLDAVGGAQARDRRRGPPGRVREQVGRRRVVPQRDGDHRRPNPGRGRVARRPAHRVDDHAVDGTARRPAGLGRARRGRGARRHLRRRRRARSGTPRCPQQHCVRVAEGGEVLETVSVDRGASPACSVATTAGRSSSWPTATARGRLGRRRAHHRVEYRAPDGPSASAPAPPGGRRGRHPGDPEVASQSCGSLMRCAVREQVGVRRVGVVGPDADLAPARPR